MIEKKELPKSFKGLCAYPEKGGKITLLNNGFGTGIAEKLDQETFEAFQKAKLIIKPENGGDWLRVVEMFEKLNCEVFWL